MSQENDIVQKGTLRYRASKIKGSAGYSAHGPKATKSLFIVFRAMHNGEKLLQMYTSEKKFHEADDPKWRAYLNDATNVNFLSDRKSFCIHMRDGGLLFLDSTTAEDAEEWVRCFNAVLFAKGLNGESTLQYEVEMLHTPILPYKGPALLELRDHDLIIWKSESLDEVVRWKLNHIRSFKAKKYDLTIVPGNRSCTGLGEFIFRSQYSIQITHAIETVVAKVKYRTSPTPSLKQSHGPAVPRPRQQIPENIPDMRDLIGSQQPHLCSLGTNTLVANIPSFVPPDVYDVPEAVAPHEAYGKLDHTLGASPKLRPARISLDEAAGGGNGVNGHSSKKNMLNRASRNMQDSPPQRVSPPRIVNSISVPGTVSATDEYEKLNHRKAKSPVSPGSPPRMKLPSNKRSDYEDIDDLMDENVKPAEYGKLEHRSEASATTTTTPALSVIPPREKRDVSKSPTLGRRGIPPPKPAPYHHQDKDKPPVPPHRTSSGPTEEEDHYEFLEDQQSSASLPESYGKLSHVQGGGSNNVPLPEEASRELGRNKSGGSLKDRSGGGGVAVTATTAAAYSLAHDLPKTGDNQNQQVEGYEMLTGVDTKSREQQHATDGGGRETQHTPEHYGKLNHIPDKAKPVPTKRTGVTSPQQENYGSLSGQQQRRHFNPYASFKGNPSEPNSTRVDIDGSADTEKVSATVKDDGIPVYSVAIKPKKKVQNQNLPRQNTAPQLPDSLPQASSQALGISGAVRNGNPPTVPPRLTGGSPRIKRRYENIRDDGQALLNYESHDTNNKPGVALLKSSSMDEENSGGAAEQSESSLLTPVKPLPQSLSMDNISGNTGPSKPLPAPRPKTKPKPTKRS